MSDSDSDESVDCFDQLFVSTEPCTPQKAWNLVEQDQYKYEPSYNGESAFYAFYYCEESGEKVRVLVDNTTKSLVVPSRCDDVGGIHNFMVPPQNVGVGWGLCGYAYYQQENYRGNVGWELIYKLLCFDSVDARSDHIYSLRKNPLGRFDPLAEFNNDQPLVKSATKH